MKQIDSIKQVNPDRITPEQDIFLVGAAPLQIISEHKKELNEDLAQEILEATQFGPDRSLDNAHVDRLLKAMRRGTFRPEQVQIILCRCNGSWYRMNGQHTCWARILLEDKKYKCPVRILRYSAANEQEMRQLYATIDRNKQRTKANVIQSYLYGSEFFPEFSKGVLKSLAEGFAVFKWGFGSRQNSAEHDGDEIAHMLRTDYLDLALKVGHFLQNHKARHMKRSPVIAAMFMTFSKCVRDAVSFWERVDDGAELSYADPRLTLRNELQTKAINAGRGGGTYKHLVPGEDMLCWCIHAWNAFRKGRDIKQLKGVGKNKMPKAI